MLRLLYLEVSSQTVHGEAVSTSRRDGVSAHARRHNITSRGVEPLLVLRMLVLLLLVLLLLLVRLRFCASHCNGPVRVL